MRYYVGTSGYSYKEWKGAFYPPKLSDKKLLSHYAQSFSSCEINSTFRRFPSASTMEAWAAQVPDSFRFVLKARQTITHFRRLQNAENQIDDFINVASLLKEKQGPLLFQLPANFKKDVPRLDAFLQYVRGRARIAMEFRNDGWFDDEVFDCLRAHSAALCVHDEGEALQAAVVRTTNWGYLRLRDESYTDAPLSDWIKKLKSQNWEEAYVFFKHEDVGSGPKLASRFLELAGQ
jgi:uncharacterized protein YecE (DUF72 family)